MNFNAALSFVTAALTLGVIAVAFYRGQRSFVEGIFALGMVLLATEAGLTGFVYQTSSLNDFIFWQKLRFLNASLLPAIWLLFSISFARANYREQIDKWKYVLILALGAPLFLTIIFHRSFVSLILAPQNTTTLFIRLGWSGYLWHIIWMLSTVAILMNLERTFRHLIGYIRWQTKFIFLGIGGIFGIRLFTQSQIVLFQGVDTSQFVVNLGALIVANIFILRSLFRGKPMNVNIQFSHQFLYTSFTVIIVGIYFIAAGLMAWISLYFEWLQDIKLIMFIIFITIIGFGAILLSDRLRIMRKRFVSRHLHRPQYDYQKIWEDFAEKTTSVANTRDLCNIIVEIISHTLEILAVSIWLFDEKKERLSFGGSTVFTAAQAEELNFFGRGGTALTRAMINQTMPIDLNERKDDWVADLVAAHELGTKDSRIRYCVPLNAAGQIIGIMTLSEKVFYEPLTFEESELVKTISCQAAAGLLNLRLSERLRNIKELEAFQTMSAFFMHDLKNLASKLSLVTQNLPLHMDNPEFRVDALRTISQSVVKINKMSSRLSLLNRKIDLELRETGINELIAVAINDVKEYAKKPVTQNLGVIPPILADQEQIYKVLENLLMNACDSLGEGGEITVTSSYEDNWAQIAVADNGCGISREFIEKSLFRPFQTTKKQGMGIGLYHCKTIIEEHGGRIEVESEQGKGTTFRVILPGKGE
jgi:putative PEP-CTERM system histidine kinase